MQSAPTRRDRLETRQRFDEFFPVGVSRSPLTQSTPRFVVSLELNQCHRISKLSFSRARIDGHDALVLRKSSLGAARLSQ